MTLPVSMSKEEKKEFSRCVKLALKEQRIKLWKAPFFVDGEINHGAVQNLSMSLSSSVPYSKSQILVCLYKEQSKSLEKHQATLENGSTTQKKRNHVDSTNSSQISEGNYPIVEARPLPSVSPYRKSSDGVSPYRDAMSMPPRLEDIATSNHIAINIPKNGTSLIEKHHVAASAPPIFVVNQQPTDPRVKEDQKQEEPSDLGCAKCAIISAIVFDVIALVLWLTRWFLPFIGSIISMSSFLVATMLSCTVPCSWKKHGGCLIVTHIIGILLWVGSVTSFWFSGAWGLWMSEADGESSDDEVFVLFGGLMVFSFVLSIGTCIVMIVACAVSCCACCALQKSDGNESGGCCC